MLEWLHSGTQGVRKGKRKRRRKGSNKEGGLLRGEMN